jgi:hypothetical protein
VGDRKLPFTSNFPLIHLSKIQKYLRRRNAAAAFAPTSRAKNCLFPVRAGLGHALYTGSRYLVLQPQRVWALGSECVLSPGHERVLRSPPSPFSQLVRFSGRLPVPYREE